MTATPHPILTIVFLPFRILLWCLRAIRWLLQPFYRFSGTLTVLAGMATWWYLEQIHANQTDGLYLFAFAIPTIAFAALAFAKLTVVIVLSRSRRWWMLLVKSNFFLGAVICFPIGLLALACYAWYERPRLERARLRELANDPWANWQFEQHSPHASRGASGLAALTHDDPA